MGLQEHFMGDLTRFSGMRRVVLALVQAVRETQRCPTLAAISQAYGASGRADRDAFARYFGILESWRFVVATGGTFAVAHQAAPELLATLERVETALETPSSPFALAGEIWWAGHPRRLHDTDNRRAYWGVLYALAMVAHGHTTWQAIHKQSLFGTEPDSSGPRVRRIAGPITSSNTMPSKDAIKSSLAYLVGLQVLSDERGEHRLLRRAAAVSHQLAERCSALDALLELKELCTARENPAAHWTRDITATLKLA